MLRTKHHPERNLVRTGEWFVENKSNNLVKSTTMKSIKFKESLQSVSRKKEYFQIFVVSFYDELS